MNGTIKNFVTRIFSHYNVYTFFNVYERNIYGGKEHREAFRDATIHLILTYLSQDIYLEPVRIPNDKNNRF